MSTHDTGFVGCRRVQNRTGYPPGDGRGNLREQAGVTRGIAGATSGRSTG